jgi:DNA-binding NarL/FixJ family response regulator
MGTIELFLIVAGVVIIALSFLIRDKKENNQEDMAGNENMRGIAENLVREELQNQLSNLSDQVLENTEAKLDKMANQKIMAVGNYSEDVLKNIEDNHNEVMFLYNMLNDKETTLKNTVRDIEAVKVSVKKMADDVKDTEMEQNNEDEKAKDDVKNNGKETTADGNDRIPDRHISQAESLESNQNHTDTNEDLEVSSEKSGGNKEKILELYRQGQTNIEIAQALNLGVGEVNLVLELFVS